MAPIEDRDNRNEADVLISYTKATFGKPDLALRILDSILEGHKGFNNKAEWNIAKFVADRTSYISVEYDDDIDVETGDWGLPIFAGGPSPVGIVISDKENLMRLREEVDDIENNTYNKISKFIEKNTGLRWTCKRCEKFFGILSPAEQVKKLLIEFRARGFRVCSKCKLMNYFEIDNGGNIVFHSQPT